MSGPYPIAFVRDERQQFAHLVQLLVVCSHL